MNYIDDYETFKVPRNAFLKGKHPDICPDCKEEPVVSDINMSFTDAELWIVQCNCQMPKSKAISGDSVSEAVFNWDNMIKHLKEKTK